MADKPLSAREAALIEQARAELAQKTRAQAGAPAAPQLSDPPAGRVERATPAAARNPNASGTGIAPEPQRAAPAATLDPAERVDLLINAARAETARLRRRQRLLYVWIPGAFIALAGLWTLLWMWQQL